MLIIILIATGILFLVSIGLILDAVFRGKKKEPAYEHDSFQESRGSGRIDDMKTEFVSDGQPGSIYTIKLSNPSDTSKSWTLGVQGGISLGRGTNNDIVIAEVSVAREQCKIIIGAGGLAIANLSDTNPTMLNGNKISGLTPLKTGDKIAMGREVLRVDFIQ